MLDYVVKVSTDAESITNEDRDLLRAEGFDDGTLWRITSTACCYACAHRMAQAIGLKPAPEYIDLYRDAGST